MVRQAVINASPLIFLSRGRHSDLLQTLADRLVVPSAVAEEILKRGARDVTAALLKSADWIEVIPAQPVPDVILEWGLGPGESAVLAYAHGNPGTEAVIDDLAGRKCARVLGLPLRGTLGIVLRAKSEGRISSARSVLEELILGGMYLSRSVLDDVLRRVGE